MIHVKWGRDVLHFPIPPLDTTLLGKLRADLAAYTGLPVGSFKLVYKGAVMKEDSASLSTYKLKENATIALIGGHTLAPEDPAASATSPVAARKAKTTAPQTEESTILEIRAELEKVRGTLVPDVDAFVRALRARVPVSGEGATGASATEASTESDMEPAPPTFAPESSAAPPTPTLVDHTRLSELLLQSLLRLDALHLSGANWSEARVQRKAAVREVQGVLDRLDGAWAAR